MKMKGKEGNAMVGLEWEVQQIMLNGMSGEAEGSRVETVIGSGRRGGGWRMMWWDGNATLAEKPKGDGAVQEKGCKAWRHSREMGWRDVRGEEITQIDWCNDNSEKDPLGLSLWEPCGRFNLGIVHLLTLNLTPKWVREWTWIMVTWGIQSFSPEKDVAQMRRVRNCRSCPKAHLILNTTSLWSQSNLCPQPAALLLANPSWNQLVKERQRKKKVSFLGREDLTTGFYFLFQFARDRIRFPFILLLYLEPASLYPFHI